MTIKQHQCIKGGKNPKTEAKKTLKTSSLLVDPSSHYGQTLNVGWLVIRPPIFTPQVIKGEVPWQYLTALHWSLTQFTPAGRLVQWSDDGRTMVSSHVGRWVVVTLIT